MQALSNAALSLPVPVFQSQFPVNLAHPGEPGTPILNDGSIDPALGGAQSSAVPIARSSRSSSPYAPSRQGSAGDPHASNGVPDAPSEQWAAPGEPSPPPARPNLKRKRRSGKPPAQNKPECFECHQRDSPASLSGQPETLLACGACGRHAHPSCLDIDADVVSSYAWNCVDCKACEVCKTNDDKVIICDHCDRAWHPACLNPPLLDTPEGTWHCPVCPPAAEEAPRASTSRLSHASQADEESQEGDGDAETDEDARTTEQEDEEVSEALMPVKSRTRAPKNSTAKRRNRTRPSQAASSSSRKRPRLRLNPSAAPAVPPTPVTPSATKLTLKLRLTQQQQQKEEPPPKPFEGILPPDEADTSRTAITPEDKQRFEKSRLAAEAKLPPPQPAGLATPSTPGPSTPMLGPLLSARPLRSQSLLMLSTPTIVVPSTPAPATPGAGGSSFFGASDGLRIKVLRFGDFDIDTWYDAPFPEEYSNLPDSRLWMCEFCLKYMKSKFSVGRHRLKCKARHPPGDEIYRDGQISVFEVDGRRNKIYCQNLCMLSKMFLSQKSLFYDVEPFLFYVMTEVDEKGGHFVGYFSKEKSSPKDYNLSCIMTLPIRQRKGWGQFLIDFSYLLSKKEGRTGTPERPLSQLGALSYKNYWTLSIMRYLQHAADNVTLEDISKATSITVEDVYVTLRDQGMIEDKQLDLKAASPAKLPRGRRSGHGSRRIGRRQSSNVATTNATPEPGEPPPVVIPKHYAIVWDRAKVDAAMAKWYAKGYVRVKPERLEWSPYLLSRDARAAAEQDVEIPTHSTHAPAERREAASASGALGDFADLALAKRSQEKQMEEDLALATKLAASEESPGRLRRTRSSATMVVPPEPQSPSPVRTRSARQPQRPATRTRSSRRNLDDDDDEDDEAAAELATATRRRTLRSRGSVNAAANSTVVAASPPPDREEGSSSPPIRRSRQSSPRKRRRIESDPPTPSSELELEPEREPMSTSASTNDGTGTPPLGAGVPVPVVGVVEAEPTYGAKVVVPSPSAASAVAPASKMSPFSFKPDSGGGIGPFYNVSATRHVREDTPTEAEDIIMDEAKEGIGDAAAAADAVNGVAEAEEWDDEADAEGEEDPDA